MFPLECGNPEVSIEGQGHFLTLSFPGFVYFVLIRGPDISERLQDHWSSGYFQYWTIVPMDHLLARLVIDDGPVNRRIVKLIQPSFIIFSTGLLFLWSRLESSPTFSYYSYFFVLFLLFSYFFQKSSYYSYFFAVKCQNDDWSQEKPR